MLKLINYFTAENKSDFHFVRFFLFFVLFVFALKFVESLIPAAHGDALYYHLVIGKVWAQQGFLAAHKEVCGALQGGLIEYIYAIPQFFSLDRFYVQQVSQSMHFLFSIGVMSLFFLSYYAKENPRLAILAALCFLTISEGGGHFLLAKNDGVGPALGLFAFVLLNQHQKFKKFDLILFSILVGLIPLIKINGLILSALLSLVFLFRTGAHKKPNQQHFIHLFIVGILISFLLVRNWYFLESPFFPAMLKLFPGLLTERMIEVYTYFMANPISWTSFVGNLHLFFFGKLIFIFAPILFFLNLRLRNYQINQIYLVSILYFLIFLLLNGGLVVERFLFPCFFLNLYFIFESIRKIPVWLYKKSIFIVYLLLILIDSRLDLSFSSIAEYWQRPGTHRQVLSAINNYNTVFDDLAPQDKSLRVISDEFNQVFHAPNSLILHSDECQIQAGFLTKCQSDQDVQKLKNYNLAVLRWARETNPCYQHIRKTGTFLKKVDNYEFWRLD